MNRLRFIDVQGSAPHEQLCETVFRGLSATPKQLPPRLFYDHEGSILFEEITDLPEYYPTRTEQAILELRAPEIVAALDGPVTMIEFGSGSSRKTRSLIEAALSAQGSLEYVPIDISREFLRICSEQLLAEYDGLTVTALAGEYFDAANALPSAEGSRLVIFLGSNLGNLTRCESIEFLSRIRKGMSEQDRLLIGIDMVKDRETLEAAYNDRAGVTAKFNTNVLGRINRELGGTFDLEAFEHHAPYDESRQRVEMRLVSRRRQTAYVESLDTEFSFDDGEHIVTEWCQKYTEASFAALCEEAGWEVERRWTDERGWFTEMLLRPVL